MNLMFVDSEENLSQMTSMPHDEKDDKFEHRHEAKIHCVERRTIKPHIQKEQVKLLNVN